MSISLGNPNPGRVGADDKSSLDNRRLTTCKLCPAGVYKGQPKTWGTGHRIPVGWSHTECAALAVGTHA